MAAEYYWLGLAWMEAASFFLCIILENVPHAPQLFHLWHPKLEFSSSTNNRSLTYRLWKRGENIPPCCTP